MRRLIAFTLLGSLALAAHAAEPDRDQALAALRKAVGFYRSQVAAHGGYVYRYSGDLTLAEGEGKADRDTIWVQPPGTPTVGEAYLDAFEATGEGQFLDGAAAAGDALLRGQLQSGGWDYHVVFDPERRKGRGYRLDGDKPARRQNRSTLDDDTSQAATRFLIRLDRVLQFKDQPVHDAAQYALDWILKSQFPSGGWYVNSDRFTDHAGFEVKKASFPETWSRVWPKDFLGCYVLNDQTHATIVDTLLLAHQVYRDPKYLAAAKKGGDFLILAQMPDPQPAWAQQYNREMHPEWSRKFEPPALSGLESQGVVRVLMDLYSATGDRKYLEPIPRALAYLKKSRLPDGRLARFYELRTNKPLYFTREYALTYDGSDAPRHYSFVVPSNLDRLESEYADLVKNGPRKPAPKPRPTAGEVRKIIEVMDARGAWVEPGGTLDAHDLKPPSGVIQSAAFAKNVSTLSRYVAP